MCWPWVKRPPQPGKRQVRSRCWRTRRRAAGMVRVRAPTSCTRPSASWRITTRLASQARRRDVSAGSFVIAISFCWDSTPRISRLLGAPPVTEDGPRNDFRSGRSESCSPEARRDAGTIDIDCPGRLAAAVTRGCQAKTSAAPARPSRLVESGRRDRPFRGGHMAIIRIHTGPDGKSHFQDIEPKFEPRGDQSEVAELIPGSSIVIRRFEPKRSNPWHHAPAHVAVFTLSGAVDIEIGDGTVRRLGPGDILIAEDLTGQGHVTREVGPDPRVSVFVPLAPPK